MAELTVDGLGELTSPAANDEIGIWDVSAGQYLKIRRDTLVGGTITGGGTVATGGYTLTVPATGTVALRDASNTFAGQQNFTTGYGGLVITLAQNETYNFGLRTAALLIVDQSTARSALFMIRAAVGQVSEMLDVFSTFSSTKNQASSINVYYESNAYYVQNTNADTRALSVHILV